MIRPVVSHGAFVSKRRSARESFDTLARSTVCA